MQRRELGRAKGGRLRHEMFSKQLGVLAHGALERLKNDTAPAQIFRERIAVHELVVAENKASRGVIETAREIENLRDQGSSVKTLRELAVDLYNKLSVPFSSMVFALIGTPLGLRRLRGGAAVGLGLSILIIFCYYVLWHGASVLGGNGQLPPVLASWLANIVGLGVGGALVWRAAN